jgi:magnesium chelatase accessory protein
VTGNNGRTIRSSDAIRVRNMAPGSAIVTLPGCGHLAHEEQPRRTADLILRVARDGCELAS